MNKAIERFKHWKRKHRRSVGVYILINVTIFIMSAYHKFAYLEYF